MVSKWRERGTARDRRDAKRQRASEREGKNTSQQARAKRNGEQSFKKVVRREWRNEGMKERGSGGV